MEDSARLTILENTMLNINSMLVRIDTAITVVREDLRQEIRQLSDRTDRSISDLSHQMDRRFEETDRKIEALDRKFEQRFEQVDKRFEQIDKRFEQVDYRFEQMEIKFDKRFEQQEIQFDKRLAKIDHDIEKTNDRVDVIHARLWSNFLWIMGTLFGLAGLIAHAVGWI